MFDTFPHSHQLESADCGPSCLRMIAKYYGRSYSIQYLREQAFNQTTNILISFLAARAVVSGEMTLGMMMSLTYIVGQLTAPIEQFIGFACAFQDAKISLERLGEIHQKEDEEQTLALKTNRLPEERTLRVEDVCFSYDGADRDYVLEHVSLAIPQHKVTAVVGASGSGKTTLVKLLLGFYEPNKGAIRVGNVLLKDMNPHVWRAHTGCVMQDGFIFSDTIARNIAVGAESIDRERLLHAVTVANIREFIDSLPLGYNTRIGMEGNPCGVQGSGVYLPGRGDECPGHQQRERDHGAPAPVLPGPHGGRGGAPFEHGQGCGQHRRPGQRAGSRGGDARRTDGETRNILQIGEEPVGIRQLNDDLPVNHHLQIVYGKRERHRITQ